MTRRINDLTTTGLSEIDSDQLDHVRLQEVDVPPRRSLHLRQGAVVGKNESNFTKLKIYYRF